MSNQNYQKDLILGIETSCDETSLCFLELPMIKKDTPDLNYISKVKVLANIVSSQIEIHKQYGGVVPEVGARKHADQIFLIWDELLEQLGNQNSIQNLKYIFVTSEPGLTSALRVGQEFAKVIKFWLEEDLKISPEIYPINHLRGHLASCFFQV
jgi:N6-L-threonylcarbamoyladenine synthase